MARRSRLFHNSAASQGKRNAGHSGAGAGSAGPEAAVAGVSQPTTAELRERTLAAVEEAGEVHMAVPPVPVSPLPPVLGDPSGLLASATATRDALVALAGIDPAGEDVAVLLAAAPVLEQARSLLELVSGRVGVALADSGSTDTSTGHTAASYLAQSPRQPRQKCRARLEVTRRLAADFPLVQQAVAAGGMSWWHGEALVRVANRRVRAGLASVQAEIVAEAGLRTFESWQRWLSGIVRALDEDGAHDPSLDRASNRLHLNWVGSAMVFGGELTGAHGLESEAAINAVAEELANRFRRDHEADESVEVPSMATLRALAFAELCRRGHAVDLCATRGPITLTTLVVHADDPTHSAFSGHGGRFPEWMVDSLRCDEMVRALVTDDQGAPLWMGRRARLATPAQRQAIHNRDGGCVFRGCDMPVGWVKLHHPIERRHGGTTDVEVMASVCPHHHGISHRNGWQMHVHVDQTFSWTTPTGATLYSQRHGRVVHDAGTVPPRIDPEEVVRRGRAGRDRQRHREHDELRRLIRQRVRVDARAAAARRSLSGLPGGVSHPN